MSIDVEGLDRGAEVERLDAIPTAGRLVEDLDVSDLQRLDESLSVPC